MTPFEQSNHHPGPSKQNGRIVRFGLILALVVVFVLPLPGELRAAGSNALFILAALGVGAIALIRREQVWQGRMSLWDEAALLCMIGMIAGFMVDHAAVEGYLLDMQNQVLQGDPQRP
ncbi:MAG: hypothetical protein ACPGOV_04540 [Magnetovibrionaceae bacterium]